MNQGQGHILRSNYQYSEGDLNQHGRQGHDLKGSNSAIPVSANDVTGRVCSVCRREFRCNAQLVIHFRIHTGEKPFKCQYCDKAFAQKNNLRGHMVRHFEEEKKQPNILSWCLILHLAVTSSCCAFGNKTWYWIYWWCIWSNMYFCKYDCYLCMLYTPLYGLSTWSL